MFDFDFDGDVDVLDFAIGGMIFNEICEEDKRSSKRSALENAGLSEFDLEMMSTKERRRALDDAGLDPDDYDYL